MTSAIGFGVDIGGSGIKGATVDLSTGELASDRVKIPTPRSYDIDEVCDTVLQVVAKAGWDGPFGCTFPGIVKRGVLYSAANLGDHWIGTDFAGLLAERSGQVVSVLNDADAAGLAELKFGAAKGHDGVVFLTTLGTGIGTALICDGVLVPNTELGHLEIDGRNAERYAAASVKEREGLSYKRWAKERLQRYYETLDFLFSPDLILVGGGVSRKSEKFLPYINIRSEIAPARFENQAGIAGAAMTAAEAADHE